MTVPAPGRAVLSNRLIASTIAVLLLLPLLPVVLAAFSRSYVFPQVIPAEWSLRAWRIVLGGGTGPALWWSIAVAGAVAAIALVVAVPAGRALGMHSFPGKGAVELMVLAPLLVPVVAVAVGLDITFLKLGLSGTFAGVVLVHLIPAAPYAVLVMAGVFANYNASFEDQARALGAGRWSVLRLVTLPAVRPGLIVAGFFAFIVSWSQYVLTLQIGGGKVVTLPVLLLATASGGDAAVTGALTIVYALPVLSLFAAASGHLLRAGFRGGAM